MTFNIATSAKQAKVASRQVAQLNTKEKNQLLLKIAAAIEHNSATIVKENNKYGIIYVNRERKDHGTTKFVVEYLESLTYGGDDDNKKIFRKTQNDKAKTYCIFESRKYGDKELAENACSGATGGTSANEGMIESNKTGNYDYS